MRLESSPPESSNPTGTSAIRCCAVTSSSVAWSSSSTSPAFAVAVTRDFRAEVALELRFLVRPHAQEMPRRQLMHAVQDGAVILERISEFQKLTDRAAIERRPKPRKRQQGLEFRREHDAAARRHPIVERLDAHRIPKQKQSTLCRAPNCECEHAADMAHAFGTPSCECIKQNLGVRLRTEAIAFRLEVAFSIHGNCRSHH